MLIIEFIATNVVKIMNVIAIKFTKISLLYGRVYILLYISVQIYYYYYEGIIKKNDRNVHKSAHNEHNVNC